MISLISKLEQTYDNIDLIDRSAIYYSFFFYFFIGIIAFGCMFLLMIHSQQFIQI